jgi:polyisoprenoid-binding protein YceI
MKSLVAHLMLVGCLLAAGCDNQGSSPVGTKSTDSTNKSDASDSRSADNNVVEARSADESQIPLGPDNARIQFVGTHVGPKPDPKARTGGFERFTGEAVINAASKTLKSVSIDIETASLWTQVGGKLTNHLNSEDFFDTREHPTAKFQSTRITPGSVEGSYTIVGDLTLLGSTKSVSFPATVSMDDSGLKLNASFTIDRTEFGMDRMQEGVEKEVTLNVAIGERTRLQGPPAGSQGRREGKGASDQPAPKE